LNHNGQLLKKLNELKGQSLGVCEALYEAVAGEQSHDHAPEVRLNDAASSQVGLEVLGQWVDRGGCHEVAVVLADAHDFALEANVAEPLLLIEQIWALGSVRDYVMDTSDIFVYLERVQLKVVPNGEKRLLNI
jgi:hypothetical protein